MSQVLFKNCKITAIKTIVPKDFINIDDEIEFFENSEKKLNRTKKIIGYGTRHVVGTNTTSLDLCYEAAKQLLDELNIKKNEIDAMLFLSQGRDYSMPTSANILHGLLDLSEDCAVMDLSQGCSGYVYGLWNSFALIQSGSAKKLLLLTGDTLSKVSFQENRLVAPIFGDSGSATLIEYTEKEIPSFFDLGSKGKQWDKITAPAGGSRIPVDEKIASKIVKDEYGNPWKLNQIIMSGIDVFNFTMEYVPKTINNVLNFADKNKDEISLFLLHQANKQIVENIAIKLGIPLHKVPTNTFSKYGNNACNSIGVHISNNFHEIKGDILLCGYGVGMSWATAIINADNIKNLGISIYSDTKSTQTTEELKEYWYNRFITKGE